jgi:hypothetical protein
MKTATILRNLFREFMTIHQIKRLLASTTGALLIGATPDTAAQIVYSVNIVGCVPPMTINLLTASLTSSQRQMLHAQNFHQLPLAARAYYLHAVAYAAGLAVVSDGFKPEHGTALSQHLENITIGGNEIAYLAPPIPPEYSQEVADYMAVMKLILQELNVLIADQIGDNSSYQQALRAGALSSIIDLDASF